MKDNDNRNVNDYPEKKGTVDIYHELAEDQVDVVYIEGDRAGLESLAELLLWLTRHTGVEPMDDHIHLHRNVQLGKRSCEVAVYCREDV